MKERIWICAAAALGVWLAASPVFAAEPEPKTNLTVIVVMIDGLSGHMIEAVDTPTFHRLRKEGTWTDRFLPTFPSVSGPTWVSLSTGCWPEHHGIVTDKFFDPELGLMDHSVDPEWLTGCELLHRVAERQGVRTGALGWWGQYSVQTGPQATYVSRAAAKEREIPRSIFNYVPNFERAAEIIHYLRMDEVERPRLILGYFPGPDHKAHFTGLDSEETHDEIRQADAAVGQILVAVRTLPFRDHVVLIVTSDHGHIPARRFVNLPRILRRQGIAARSVTTGTTAFLYFDDKSTVDRAFSALAQYTEFDVFRRSEQPPYAHLGESERVGDLVVSAHPGLYFADTDLWPWYLRPLAVFGPDFETTPFLGAGLYSAHGYPPDTPGVQGVFYAWGNDIPKGRHLESIRMIDVNPTVTQLLGILPARLVDGAPIDALFAARSVAQMPKGSRGDLAVGSAEQPVHRLRRIKVVPP